MAIHSFAGMLQEFCMSLVNCHTIQKLNKVLIKALNAMLEVFRSTSSKLILLLVIVLVAILQYQFWLGEGGFFLIKHLCSKFNNKLK